VFAARCFGAEVFPERMCETLPEVDREVKAWVGHVAPELSQVPVRELSEKAALEVFGRAAAGWGGYASYLSRVVRSKCEAFLRDSESSLCSTTATESSTGTRGSIATSSSRHGSSSTARAAATSRTCTGCVPKCCSWGASRSGPCQGRQCRHRSRWAVHVGVPSQGDSSSGNRFGEELTRFKPTASAVRLFGAKGGVGRHLRRLLCERRKHALGVASVANGDGLSSLFPMTSLQRLCRTEERR